MKGDIVVIDEHHRKAAEEIVPFLLKKIKTFPKRYTLTVAGESGSGKSETAEAIAEELQCVGLNAVILAQDDYFYLPPKLNDQKRRDDPEWLGPHVEVNLMGLDDNLDAALQGKAEFTKPLVDYDKNIIGTETVSLRDIDVVIAEGTYTSLLKNVQTRIFINRNRLDTLAHRQKRNRGNEAFDPFVENILVLEHMIIAGHMQLADFVISKDYDVIFR